VQLFVIPNNIKKHIRTTTKFHSRRHEGGFCGLIPQTNFQAPKDWSSKHYKSGVFVKILDAKPPCTNVKPLLKISDDGSAKFHGSQEKVSNSS